MIHPFSIRLATSEDIPALESLIARSVRELQANHYSEEQREAALGTVFGVDKQLIEDGTYFVVQQGSTLIGCGGWSKRDAVCGTDTIRRGQDRELDPANEPARIRAFFVHPDWARRGIGRLLLQQSEAAIRDAGFSRALLVATLPGELLYASCGYIAEERYETPLCGRAFGLPVVRMTKVLTSPPVLKWNT